MSDSESDSDAGSDGTVRRYGFFQCPDCGRQWQSAYVWCHWDTCEPAYGQECARCKDEGDALMIFPYRVERLKCPRCGSQTNCDCFATEDTDEEEQSQIEDDDEETDQYEEETTEYSEDVEQVYCDDDQYEYLEEEEEDEEDEEDDDDDSDEEEEDEDDEEDDEEEDDDSDEEEEDEDDEKDDEEEDDDDDSDEEDKHVRHINSAKPHRSDLCGRCLSGTPCTSQY